MAPSNTIPDGYELLAGRSRKNAIKALDLADERGLDPQSVLTASDGYLIPIGSDDAVYAEEIVFPDPEKDSHAEIDRWAATFPDDLGGPISFDGMDARNTSQPTKTEKVAHLNKIVTERATANDNQNQED